MSSELFTPKYVELTHEFVKNASIRLVLNALLEDEDEDNAMDAVDKRILEGYDALIAELTVCRNTFAEKNSKQ